MLALSAIVTIALVAGVIVALGFIVGLIAIRVRGRPERRAPDIPPGMAPGPADEVLERRQLERVMAWGVVFTLIFAVNVAVIWFLEPEVNVDNEIELVGRSVDRGSQWFQLASEENPTGFGCARCHGAEAQGGSVPFTFPDGHQDFYPVPSLNDVCGGAATGHGSITSVDDIRTTITEGREGTPMPSWSVRFQGPMNDQQINDLINYIVSIQVDIPEEDNVCLNPAPATTGETTDGGGGEETPAGEGQGEGGGEPSPEASP